MLSLYPVFLSMSLVAGVPWYPVMYPLHTRHQHRHTTHIVTHPVIHTRVLVLEEDDHHHHQQHNYGHDHHHGHSRNHNHGHMHHHHKTAIDEDQGRYASYSKSISRDPNQLYGKTSTTHHYDRHKPHGGHSYEDYNGDNYHHREEIKYSMPVEESPWKPLSRVPNHVPKGYLPLKYLGLDEEQVAKIVKDAMNEIEDDFEQEPTPRYPTGIQDVIGRRPKPLKPSMQRGAVFYDDDPPKGRHVTTTPRYVPNYSIKSDPSGKNALRLNIQCQCQTPY